MRKKILIVSDNAFLIKSFSELTKPYQEHIEVTYSCSVTNQALLNNKTIQLEITALNIKSKWEEISKTYDLIFSLHCKQLFPDELVRKVKCINVHPGLNPYNRGWFPQVFSIINHKKAGATIHEIDEELDHGAIIAQKEIVIEKWDTSLTAYNKIQNAEVELLKENLQIILDGNYKVKLPDEEGNVNLKKDFNALCAIDLEKKVTMNEAIDYLRAMTHGKYKNAYFTDQQSGKRIYVTIDLDLE